MKGTITLPQRKTDKIGYAYGVPSTNTDLYQLSNMKQMKRGSSDTKKTTYNHGKVLHG